MVLKTGSFPPPHTAVNLKMYFDSIISQFGLQNKKIKVITDGGNNMVAFVKLTKLKRFPCLAHKINRLIQHDLMESNEFEVQPLKDLVKKMRKIQEKLHYQVHELAKIERSDKQKQLQLIIDFEDLSEVLTADDNQISIDELENSVSMIGIRSIGNTRWCCLHKLANRFMNHLGTIKKYFHDHDMFEYILKNNEVELLSGFIQLLEIFSNVTKIIEGDKYPTITYCLRCLFFRVCFSTATFIFRHLGILVFFLHCQILL